MSTSEKMAERSTNKVGYRFILLVSFGLGLVVVGLFLSEPFIFISVPIMCFLGFVLLRFKQPDPEEIEIHRTLERSQIR